MFPDWQRVGTELAHSTEQRVKEMFAEIVGDLRPYRRDVTALNIGPGFGRNGYFEYWLDWHELVAETIRIVPNVQRMSLGINIAGAVRGDIGRITERLLLLPVI